MLRCSRRPGEHFRTRIVLGDVSASTSMMAKFGRMVDARRGTFFLSQGHHISRFASLAFLLWGWIVGTTESFSVGQGGIRKLPQRSTLTAALAQSGVVAEEEDPSQQSYTDYDHKTNPVTLIPVSKEPLILVSSEPLLTETECQILVEHKEFREDESSSEALAILRRVSRTVDRLTGCPAHDTEKRFPRYIEYEPQPGSRNSLNLETLTEQQVQVFPDGLHVDTNNGHFFRHLSALLYLTTNDNGATIFPLAKDLSKQEAENPSISMESLKAERAAHRLIRGDIQHTKTETRDLYDDCRTLEETAMRVYKGESTVGVRVVPKAGHLCVFCNIDANTGLADPMSFHAGEALLGETQRKAVLTFFKEIPLSDFGSRLDFGRQAEKTKQRLLQTYCD